jgi:hypothetical protein
MSRRRPAAPLRTVSLARSHFVLTRVVLSPPVRRLPPPAPTGADSGPASSAPPTRYPPSAGGEKAASAYGRVEVAR